MRFQPVQLIACAIGAGIVGAWSPQSPSAKAGSRPAVAPPVRADASPTSRRARSAADCVRLGCEVALTRLARISDAAEPGILPDFAIIHRDRRGRFVANSRAMDRVLVFDTLGRLIRQIGRRGNGPGEFQRVVSPTPGPGDSLFAHDFALRTVTVIGPDLRVARTAPQHHAPSLFSSDGSYVVAEQIRTAAQIGYPMHFVDRNGRLVRSFGTDTPQYRPDIRRITDRVVGAGAKGTIWAAAPGRYVLEQWNPSTGRKLQQVRVRSGWFRESVRAEGAGERPAPLIERVWQDSMGLVWVLIRDADLRWQADTSPAVHRPVDWEKLNRTYDWVVEVVNPASGAVVAHRRFASHHWNRAPDDLLVSANHAEPSVVAFDVWQPQLLVRGSR
jgi:hypothetical protein